MHLWEENVELHLCPKVPQSSGETAERRKVPQSSGETAERRTAERRMKDTVDPTMAQYLMRLTHYGSNLAWVAVASHDQDFLPAVQTCRNDGRTIHFVLVDIDGSRAVKDAAGTIHYLAFPFLERLGKATSAIADAREHAHIHALATCDAGQVMPLFRDAVLGLQCVFERGKQQHGAGLNVLAEKLLHENARNGLSQCSRLEIVAIVYALRRLKILVTPEDVRARFVIDADHELVKWANMPTT